jgi:hypothetical protein
MLKTDRPVSNSHTQFRKGVEDRFNEALDDARQIEKAWNERFTVKNPLLSERYLKGQIRIRIEFSLIGSPENFCVIFERERIDVRRELNLKRSIGLLGDGAVAFVFVPRGLCGRGNADPLAHCAYCYEQSVLVRDVQAMQGEESLVPSLVWLQCLDEANRFDAGTLQYSFNSGFAFVGGIKNRECGLLGNRAVVGLNELTRDVIQRGPQLMDNLANYNCPTCRRLLDAKRRARLGVIVSDKRLTFKFVDRHLQIRDVLFGPLDLRLNRRDA